MLYIGLAIIGLAALIIGIILTVRRKKIVGITLTVIGALAFIAGIILTVCVILLVDFIHNQPPDESPVTEITEKSPTDIETVKTEDLIIYETGEVDGNDWRTWRSCSEDYKMRL